jgi:hypothetical protein
LPGILKSIKALLIALGQFLRPCGIRVQADKGSDLKEANEVGTCETEEKTPTRCLIEPPSMAPKYHVHLSENPLAIYANFQLAIKDYPLGGLTQLVRPGWGRKIPNTLDLIKALESQFNVLNIKGLLMDPPQEVYNAIKYRIVMLLAEKDPLVEEDFFDMKNYLWQGKLLKPSRKEKVLGDKWLIGKYGLIDLKFMERYLYRKLYGISAFSRFPDYIPRLGEDPISPRDRKKIAYRLYVDGEGRILSFRVYSPELIERSKMEENLSYITSTYYIHRHFHMGELGAFPPKDLSLIEELRYEDWDYHFYAQLRSIFAAKLSGGVCDESQDYFYFPLSSLNREKGTRLFVVNCPGYIPDRRAERQIEYSSLVLALGELNKKFKASNAILTENIDKMLGELKEKFGELRLQKLLEHVHLVFDKGQGLMCISNKNFLTQGVQADGGCVLKTRVPAKELTLVKAAELTKVFLKARFEFERPFKEGQLALGAPGTNLMKLNCLLSLFVQHIRHSLQHNRFV